MPKIVMAHAIDLTIAIHENVCIFWNFFDIGHARDALVSSDYLTLQNLIGVMKICAECFLSWH